MTFSRHLMVVSLQPREFSSGVQITGVSWRVIGKNHRIGGRRCTRHTLQWYHRYLIAVHVGVVVCIVVHIRIRYIRSNQLHFTKPVSWTMPPKIYTQ